MKFVWFFFFVVGSFDCFAFQQPAPRPKIGVALQGGGAKGMAHIGALQWLEEHHIPIDYLAGTSMGGLLGGLYATGHSPAEIQWIVKDIDWNTILLGDTLSRPSLPAERGSALLSQRIGIGIETGSAATRWSHFRTVSEIHH